MTDHQIEQRAKSIDGISIYAFLQMLEHERKSCTLVINQEDSVSYMYLKDGSLIDSQHGDEHGLDAAFAILALENPTFYLTKSEERIQRITLPLGHILLAASTQHDEKQYQTSGKKTAAVRPKSSVSPALAAIIDKIIAIPGVQHYYFLNKQGKLIAQSSKKQKMGDFIAYCIVSGIQMREALGAKGLHNIRIKLQDDTMLLIVPVSGLTIGLLLSQETSLAEVYSGLRSALTTKTTKS
ncbi:DUF4388 domain-containing protein [Desulfogranum japonicum]|uniref:DUF4388 domain-containing protein n=1 Tax=Desulfogranum japonicum TaxID=231447 RepID=UPI0003FD19F4|nr:DUF4388 domain-containing protein [Desulfogranum japonicum]